MDWLRYAHANRLSAAIAVVWCVLVAVALVVTLDSLAVDDFDGLNNLYQVPFALPWMIIPIGGFWSSETDAWICAAMGWLNGLIILFILPEWMRRRGRA